MNQIETKLKEMGLALPEPLPSAGSYRPWIASERTISEHCVFISGQVPVENGRIIQGVIGNTLTEKEGAHAAKICALHVLAQLKQACAGDLDRVKSCLRLGGFVNAASDFGNHPEVINGASDLLIAVMGARGRHTRFAVGVSSLPRRAAVEIEALFEIKF